MKALYLGFLLCLSTLAVGQVNLGLQAVSTHSGGGASATGYGPELYNDGNIPPYLCGVTYCWGWVSTNGWIEYTWPTPQTFNAVKFHKDNRPMTTCVFQYWDGTTYVNFYNYSSTAIVDSVGFPNVTASKLRFNSIAGSGNPNFREIQVFAGPTTPVDMALIQLVSPRTNCGLTNTEEVKVILRSLGTLTLPIGTPLQMRLTLDNSSPITETFQLTSPLNYYDTIHYTFNATLDMSLEKPYLVRVEVVAPGDGEPSNDLVEADVRNNFTNEFPIRADFENWGAKSGSPSCNVALGPSFGGWVQPDDDDGSWLVGQGASQTVGTGPNIDYSELSVSGKYLYINTSQPCNVAGNRYLLRSSCIDLSQLANPGMNFAYHMYGSNMGSLHIDIVRFNDGYVFQNVWSRSSNQGNKWYPVVLPLDNFKQEGVIQIQIRAVSGNGNQSEIAIDDLRIGELPQFSIGPASMQDCGFVKLDTKIDDAVYSWSTGEDTRAITISNNGQSPLNMKVGVMVEKDGMYNIDSMDLTLEPGPVVVLGPDRLVICGQQNYTLDAKNGAMQHTWDNQATGQFRTVSESGIYWVSVNDGQGCVKADTIDLVMEDIPVAQFTYNNVTGYSFIQFNSSGSSNGTYLWDFGDGNTSDLKDPKHYFINGGQQTVTLTIENECGKVTTSQTITVWPTGVDDFANLRDISLFPNPTQGAVTLTWNNSGVDKATLQLVDAVGRIVWQQVVNPARTSNWQYAFEVNQPAGIYQLIIKTENGTVIKSLVLSR